MEEKRRKVASGRSEWKKELDIPDYINLILTALGYEDITQDIKDEFIYFIQEWMKEFSKTVTIQDSEIQMYDYLHQLFPLHWTVFIRYNSSKKASPKVNISKENKLEEEESDSYDPTEDQSIKSIPKANNAILTNHLSFLDRRGILLDKDVYTSTRLCLSTLSSSSSFISNTVGKSPSNVICQFANLVLFYTLCDQISRASQLYHIKKEELHSSLNASIPIDVSKLDISKSITLEYAKLSKKKRKISVKKVDLSTIPDEYDFINSMLFHVC